MHVIRFVFNTHQIDCKFSVLFSNLEWPNSDWFLKTLVQGLKIWQNFFAFNLIMNQM